MYVCVSLCSKSPKHVKRHTNTHIKQNTRTKQTPYAPGIEQASCGLYGKTRVGFVPMLPILKRVALLPFDPTVAATNVEEGGAEAEVLEEA